jgi:hypothetical protein
MTQITGGCRCGQVRYKADAEPIFTGICHCTACQKESGGAFNIVVTVPQAALAMDARRSAHSGEGDRPFRPKLITDSGNRDHADNGRERPA